MRCVIFDLDGTLTASAEGILRTVAYTAETLGFPMPPAEEAMRFVGPPLKWSFMHELGMDEETSTRALQLYRERYHRVGLFENRVYPGIRGLLRRLKKRGDWVAIATGKPTEPSRRIIEHFGLSRYFHRIVGPGPGVEHPDKADLIREALPETYDEVWMVGDRRFDIEGGRALGVHTAGAGWGYGTREELEAAGCERYTATVAELTEILCPGEETPPGAFVSVEGLDGCGKTTQLRLLSETLERWGFSVRHTREPGGTPIGEQIRGILLDPANTAMDPVTEALLYAASRAQHVREVIRPAMAAGEVVLSDRFVDSSIAYQGGGRGLGTERAAAINREAVDGTLPRVTLFLDLPHEAALARRYGASAPDRMEQESGAFHARVEEAFHRLARENPDRYVVLDAALPVEALARQAAEAVLARLYQAEEEADRP